MTTKGCAKGSTLEHLLRSRPESTKGMRQRAINVPQSKVGLKLPTHVHEPATLAMHTCRPRAWIPHHTLHRGRIIELVRHAHLHLQHGVDHVHTQASQPITPAHCGTHAIRPHLLGSKGQSVGVGHRKRVLLLIALVVHQLIPWLHRTR